ncbi:MAG: hypothetical protein Hyperionvirus1_109 [Hyperionvirus sp.]|uniref:Uncharacterized protein n=1 Tax=Hyperionvirus sp. TaxID=2487770 RepID=A0A3G5A5K0_9VIRU|nr:MAG: hypothetical protein Hyperionvirus1_109 [Hyperionvirus sp.]
MQAGIERAKNAFKESVDDYKQLVNTLATLVKSDSGSDFTAIEIRNLFKIMVTNFRLVTTDDFRETYQTLANICEKIVLAFEVFGIAQSDILRTWGKIRSVECEACRPHLSLKNVIEIDIKAKDQNLEVLQTIGRMLESAKDAFTLAENIRTELSSKLFEDNIPVISFHAGEVEKLQNDVFFAAQNVLTYTAKANRKLAEQVGKITKPCYYEKKKIDELPKIFFSEAAAEDLRKCNIPTDYSLLRDGGAAGPAAAAAAAAAALPPTEMKKAIPTLRQYLHDKIEEFSQHCAHDLTFKKTPQVIKTALSGFDEFADAELYKFFKDRSEDRNTYSLIWDENPGETNWPDLSKGPPYIEDHRMKLANELFKILLGYYTHFTT